MNRSRMDSCNRKGLENTSSHHSARIHRGEGDDALDVALVARLNDGAVDGDGDGGEEALLAARAQLAYRH